MFPKGLSRDHGFIHAHYIIHACLSVRIWPFSKTFLVSCKYVVSYSSNELGISLVRSDNALELETRRKIYVYSWRGRGYQAFLPCFFVFCRPSSCQSRQIKIVILLNILKKTSLFELHKMFYNHFGYLTLSLLTILLWFDVNEGPETICLLTWTAVQTFKSLDCICL